MKTATEMIKPIIPKMDPITVAAIESRNVTKKQDNDNPHGKQEQYCIMFYHKVFHEKFACCCM